MPDLIVTISGGAGPTTYSLKVTEASVSYRRAPLQAPLPGNISPLLIDLGQCSPSVMITGIVDTTAGTDGANSIPNKTTLEGVLLTWWNTTITITVNSDAYIGKISDFSFVVVGAQEDRWAFRINFVTNKRTGIADG